MNYQKKLQTMIIKFLFQMLLKKNQQLHDKFWCVPLPKGKNYKRFLDFQNDVAVSDIEIALKRRLSIY